jgi:alpha-mannosidase
MMADETCGISIGNIGLYEYETMDDTIAVTLVRSVGELGDWGVFPTEVSQVQKSLTFEYCIIPFQNEEDVYSELAEYQYPFTSTQVFGLKEEKLAKEILTWSGKGLKHTAFKQKMNGNDIISRWTNYSDKEQVLTIQKTDIISNLYLSNVIEEKLETLQENGGKWQITVKPYEILTLGTEKC